MTEPIVALRVDAEEVSVALLARALTDLSDLMSDISSEIVGKGQVTWVVDALSRNSPALIQMRPVRSSRKVDSGELGEVRTVFASGLSLLSERSEWPTHFSEHALERLRSLARQANDDVRVQIGSADNLVDLTSTIAANIDRLLAPSATMLGSIEGRMESVTIHGTPEFSLYDLLDHRRIRCFFGRRVDVEDVSAGIGRRVNVYGVMKVRDDGVVISITAESIEILPKQSELMDYREARGILGGGR